MNCTSEDQRQLQIHGTAIRYCYTVLPYGTAIRYCHTVLPYGTAIRYCHTVLPYGTAIRYCCTVLPYGTAIRYCHTVLLYGTAIRYCHTVLLYGTICYTVQKLCFMSHGISVGLVRLLQLTAIIALNSINRLDFVSEALCSP